MARNKIYGKRENRDIPRHKTKDFCSRRYILLLFEKKHKKDIGNNETYKIPFEKYDLNNDNKIFENDVVESFILHKHNTYNIPLLYVDVNMNLGKKGKILVFNDDSPEEIAQTFSHKYGIFDFF